MRGTTRPSDYTREPVRKPPRDTHVKHGDRFGSLTVEGIEFRNAHRRRCAHVRCDCGTPYIVRVYHLTHGSTTRCPRCRRRSWGRTGTHEAPRDDCEGDRAGERSQRNADASDAPMIS